MFVVYFSMLETDDERNKMTEIYEEHRHALLMYALKILKNQELAEDAVHNAFISIIEQKEKYFNLSCRDFRFSAVIIVRNKSIDILRKQKPHLNMQIEDFEFYLESEDKPLDEQVIFNSEYETIRKHLNAIDEISRQVLILKYYHGMSYKEIGERLGMTPKHVDTKIMRAKEKVRKLIKQEGRFDG
ncbi:MAG: RNA polymerase sigma factor [Oscillospiraceae bacterium]|nr:RNA polymerase sigma factor [Oscillospiraceae bacterium]